MAGEKNKEQLTKELEEALAKIGTLNTGLETATAKLNELGAANTKLTGENQQLTTQVTTLQGRIDEMERIMRRAEEQHTVLGQGFSEEQIREKIKAGLDFDDAIEVLINQRTEDEARAKAEKAAK